MSMYGWVTDAQVFSRELSSQEMVEVASCRQFPQGDILSWDREPWVLRSPWNRSEAELLDLERDVCRLVLQKVASELHPKVRNHGEGPY